VTAGSRTIAAIAADTKNYDGRRMTGVTRIGAIDPRRADIGRADTGSSLRATVDRSLRGSARPPGASSDPLRAAERRPPHRQACRVAVDPGRILRAVARDQAAPRRDRRLEQVR
jgi:hypothetical protein